MDVLDWKILHLLDWHGREPVSKIAKATKSNKDVVAYRIKRLEEQNIITRYFPVINTYKLGYHTCRFYFDLEEMDEKQEQAFVTYLDEEINAGLIFRMDYPYRYGIVVWVKSIYALEDIIKRIKGFLGKTLVKYNHTFFCSFKLYPKDYLFNKQHHELSYDNEPSDNQDYDLEDFNILQELTTDARKSTVQIAKNLGIPQSTVSTKIKQLEKKKILLGYRAEINFIKLGHMNYFLEIYLDNNDELSQIEGWADACKHSVWLQKVVGTCDIEIEVEVKDRVQLESLLKELRTTFKSIRKIVFWSQEYMKFTFLPQTD